MSATADKLWNRDFSLVIFGQVISIFGNMVISFALPLYVLDISGSPALYGLVLGVPYISLLIMSPIGGIMADRLKKQRIMFWLDAVTTVIIVLYMVTSGLFASVVPIIIVKLLALNAIQGMYIPAVQASVPALVPSDKLTSGNAAVSVVNSLSNMAGMAVAGVVYGRFGLFPILAVSALCFAFTAVIDLFIRIPFKKQIASGSIAQIVMSDISVSVRFIVKEKPILAKSTVVIFLLSMLAASIMMVGFPVLITQYLGFGMEFVGINQSIVMIGGLIGGIAAGALGGRLTIFKSLLLIAAASLTLVSIGLVIMFDVSALLAYITITAVGALIMIVVQLFNIAIITYVQQETPAELVGKVMSVLMILPFLAQALGQMLYGGLFELFAESPWIVVYATAFLAAAIALYSSRFFRESNTSVTNGG